MFKKINLECEMCEKIIDIDDVETMEDGIIIELKCGCGYKKIFPIALKDIYFKTNDTKEG